MGEKLQTLTERERGTSEPHSSDSEFLAGWLLCAKGISICNNRFLRIILAVSSIFDEHIFELPGNNVRSDVPVQLSANSSQTNFSIYLTFWAVDSIELFPKSHITHI